MERYAKYTNDHSELAVFDHNLYTVARNWNQNENVSHPWSAVVIFKFL